MNGVFIYLSYFVATELETLSFYLLTTVILSFLASHNIMFDVGFN